MAFIINSLGLTAHFNSSNTKEENIADKIKSDPCEWIIQIDAIFS